MAHTLQSMIHILQNTLLPKHHLQQNWIPPDDDHKTLLESLLEKVIALRDLLETSPPLSNNKLEIFESKITDAVYKAEDIVESCRAGLITTIFTEELKNVIHEFDSAVEEMMDESWIQDAKPNAESGLDLSHKKFLVGLNDDLIQLKDRLTRDQAKLEVIPIVGMGGLGKTTLAPTVYDDPLIVSHFDTCCWARISQGYHVRSILVELLSCVIGKLSKEMLTKKSDALAVTLYQSLKDRSYLIVLDDMWSTQVWDEIKMLFPNDKNRSRIMLTTREFDVANYANLSKDHHEMELLDEFASWKLLQQRVFAEEHCLPALEKLGEKIAGHCRGLPLAITVIAGLLSSDKQNHNFWEKVSHNTSSVVTGQDQISSILSLSYDHMPSHLKPCFLYFGAFPEDHSIRTSRLIELWVAEGFLKPIRDKSLEEAGGLYLKALVDRNLITIHQQNLNGKVRSYRIHDLLRDLCVKKAASKRFLNVVNSQVHPILDDNPSMCRVFLHSSYCIKDIYASEVLMSLARFFMSTGGLASHAILSPIFFALRLLRVLYILEMTTFPSFPEEILQLHNLRYLAFSCASVPPPSISTLCDLQTFIWSGCDVEGSDNIPSELWTMPELRHVSFEGFSVCYSLYDNLPDDHVQESLQTLGTVEVSGEDSLVMFPNLNKLSLYSSSSDEIYISELEKLESLKQMLHFSIRLLFHLR